jgi:hypothetical protein
MYFVSFFLFLFSDVYILLEIFNCDGNIVVNIQGGGSREGGDLNNCLIDGAR